MILIYFETGVAWLAIDSMRHAIMYDYKIHAKPLMKLLPSLSIGVFIAITQLEASANVMSANAANVIVPVVGCGTGCLVLQKQIGEAYEDRKGLRKVLVEQTYQLTSTAGSWGGKDRRETVRKFFIAECSRRKANFTSFTSNGTGEDDIFRWTDVPYNKESRSSGPNWATYIQYDRICKLRLN